MRTAVLKVGGSLALHPKKLRELCAKLSSLAAEHKLLVVPGGGEFADVVRQLDQRFNLSAAVSHRMAILGMDQYGFLLSDVLPKSVTVNTFHEAKKAMDTGMLPVFLPSSVMLSEDPLEHSWAVTSDSIAAYIANRMHADKLLLITDVDGVYTADPKMHPAAQLLKETSASQLLNVQVRTSVDIFLPKMLTKGKVECFVVNGLFPNRIEAILDEQETLCTKITPD